MYSTVQAPEESGFVMYNTSSIYSILTRRRRRPVIPLDVVPYQVLYTVQ